MVFFTFTSSFWVVGNRLAVEVWERVFSSAVYSCFEDGEGVSNCNSIVTNLVVQSFHFGIERKEKDFFYLTSRNHSFEEANDFVTIYFMLIKIV